MENVALICDRRSTLASSGQLYQYQCFPLLALFSHRRSQEKRCFIVPWCCVDGLVITPSRSEVFLSPSIVGIDARDGPRWLFLPNPLFLTLYGGLFLHHGTSVSLVYRITEVRIGVMAASLFLHCVFYGFEIDLGLDLCLMTRDSVLMYLPSSAVADTD